MKLKRERGGKPKRLEAQKDHEIRAPKPMKEKERKEKKYKLENGRRTSVKELSRDLQRLPKDPRGI